MRRLVILVIGPIAMGSASIGACGDDSGESLFDGGAGDAQVQDENRLGDGYAADAHQGSFGDRAGCDRSC